MSSDREGAVFGLAWSSGTFVVTTVALHMQRVGRGSKLIQSSCYAARCSIRLPKGADRRAHCICRASPRPSVGRVAWVSAPFKVRIPFSGDHGRVRHTSADLSNNWLSL